ncbi:DUF222 domain-containing protein [Candidatus Poriferisocius sp.]|uniref:HNH endonuclease signature motif containing protein n=1 Tax=Candidatus Poriferisocius sp. TaxID=3101276 RepID=UPI003B02C7A7
MEFSSVLAGQAGAETAVDGGCGAAVCVSRVDVAGLSDAGLRGRLGVLGGAESQLEALKAQTMAELARRHETVGAKKVAREVLRSSPSQAHHDVKAAERLAGLAATSEALASGEVPADHARLIARASSEGPIDERELVEAAKTQTYDELTKTVKRQQHELSGDGGQSIHDRRKQKRSARLFQNGDTGLYVLNAEFDPIAGNHIAGVLADKERELWRAEDSRARRSPQQRAADALAELILHPEKGKAAGIALVLVADYDTALKELVNARLSDGTPLPAKELVKLAHEADIFPAVFNARTQDLWLGRRRRCASDAQRIALMVRDKACVGCGADANRSFAHHIKHWKNGGATDYPNLVTVCNDCHHDIHERHHQVEHDRRTGRRSVVPPPDAFPDSGTTTWQPKQLNPVLRN